MRVCLPFSRLTGLGVTHNPRLLRISTPSKFIVVHTILTIRVARKLQDFHLIALFRIVDPIETAIP